MKFTSQPYSINQQFPKCSQRHMGCHGAFTWGPLGGQLSDNIKTMAAQEATGSIYPPIILPNYSPSMLPRGLHLPTHSHTYGDTTYPPTTLPKVTLSIYPQSYLSGPYLSTHYPT